MITKKYKLYGPVDALPGVRCHVTCVFNFALAKRKKLLWIIRDDDYTPLNDYTVVLVTAESEEECRSFLDEQISDGFLKIITLDGLKNCKRGR